MLNATISKMILNALTKGQSGSSPSITRDAFLALLTTLPGDSGTGGVEVSATTMKGYSRLKLGSEGVSSKSLDGKDFFNTSGAVWNDGKKAYVVENQANMQMSAIEENVTESAVVKGFAICKTISSALSATEMLAWGPLVDTSGNATTVTLTGGSAPIFYYNSDSTKDNKGDFVLMLGSASTSA